MTESNHLTLASGSVMPMTEGERRREGQTLTVFWADLWSSTSCDRLGRWLFVDRSTIEKRLESVEKIAMLPRQGRPSVTGAPDDDEIWFVYRLTS